ncbi:MULTISPECIES: hypothetical protein [unclassified Methylocaldum]|jgi:hypothetical protein|uniref:hypothetical protein n=1 Tax=unclassified Methylocaldum TaxID=2622260 RepID=UPI00098B4088|nr:hypothetical protein [Methylocaldum sp. RMAD-M]MVF22982.1 hypothetical protein [Methylocaldum sp. BRCS4]
MPVVVIVVVMLVDMNSFVVAVLMMFMFVGMFSRSHGRSAKHDKQYGQDRLQHQNAHGLELPP